MTTDDFVHVEASGWDRLGTLRCQCGSPACEDTLRFVPKCHPDAHCDCRLSNRSIVFTCAECKKLVVVVAVAPETFGVIVPGWLVPK